MSAKLFIVNYLLKSIYYLVIRSARLAPVGSPPVAEVADSSEGSRAGGRKMFLQCAMGPIT